MFNKKTAAILFMALLAGVTPLFAQSNKKVKAGDDEIMVPEQILEPPMTLEQINNSLKQYINAFAAPDMPATLKEYKANPDKYRSKRIGKAQSANAVIELGNFIRDSRVAGVKAVDPDLLEVTGVDSKWFLDMYAIAEKSQAPGAVMDKVLISGDEKSYKAALKEYNDVVGELTQYMKKKPKKMDDAALKKLKAANRARREKEYIAQYKKKVEEKAAAIEKQQAEMEKQRQQDAKSKKSSGK